MGRFGLFCGRALQALALCPLSLATGNGPFNHGVNPTGARPGLSGGTAASSCWVSTLGGNLIHRNQGLNKCLCMLTVFSFYCRVKMLPGIWAILCAITLLFLFSLKDFPILFQNKSTFPPSLLCGRNLQGCFFLFSFSLSHIGSAGLVSWLQGLEKTAEWRNDFCLCSWGSLVIWAKLKAMIVTLRPVHVFLGWNRTGWSLSPCFATPRLQG